MKCPKCNGRGTVGYFHIDHFVDIECDRCHGQGEVSADTMTNEEHLKSCNTEQLAEFLYDIRYDYQIPWKNKDIVEWLKQPHTKE